MLGLGCGGGHRIQPSQPRLVQWTYPNELPKLWHNQNHVPVGTPVDYADAPPAFGAHWNEAGVAPAPFAKKFYTDQDRPELEALVHNLEHGYTILWYDSTIAGDKTAMDEIEAIADKFSGSSTSI
ncbi:DUF3105 domain-containing protein [Acidovorax sp. BLS4]|uniref:DUF3105 domain-containing protein n=1 Tax=Acidovorax sp. BLS4 TaxID=3273430 RepID=UPI002943D2E9|nr:DUF3105 domain-containing protein [Paracidovorax avenae]WOI45580.1 DUF3105 domain-containing protein [Paracidovorax avenae]